MCVWVYVWVCVFVWVLMSLHACSTFFKIHFVFLMYIWSYPCFFTCCWVVAMLLIIEVFGMFVFSLFSSVDCVKFHENALKMAFSLSSWIVKRQSNKTAKKTNKIQHKKNRSNLYFGRQTTQRKKETNKTRIRKKKRTLRTEEEEQQKRIL